MANKMIIMYYGNSCPVGWLTCDGTNGALDLRGLFIAGANLNYPGIRSEIATGTNNKVSSINHTHSISDHVHEMTLQFGTSSSVDSSTNAGDDDIGTLHADSDLVLETQTVVDVSMGAADDIPPYYGIIFCQKEISNESQYK